jgi:hypothetical protein
MMKVTWNGTHGQLASINHNGAGLQTAPSFRRKHMGKVFMFIGTAGLVLSLVELVPEGKWLYLGLLVFSTALISLGAAETEDAT